jgi:predicted TIM-barrel enzyme
MGNPERHRTVFISPCAPLHPAGAYVLAPWLDVLPAGNPDLLSLLPVGDLNGATMAALSATSAANAFVALLLADPFLRVRDTAALLGRAGARGVANFPTTQIVDGETARAFESAGARASREIAMLKAFGEAGLATLGFASGPESARAMAAATPTFVVLHPGVALADWRQRAAAALAVGRTIGIVRDACDRPVLVYRPLGFGPELDQAIADADGLVARPG